MSHDHSLRPTDFYQSRGHVEVLHYKSPFVICMAVEGQPLKIRREVADRLVLNERGENIPVNPCTTEAELRTVPRERILGE